MTAHALPQISLDLVKRHKQTRGAIHPRLQLDQRHALVHRVVYLPNRNSFLMFGGETGTWYSPQPLQDVWEYNPGTNQWTRIDITSPIPRNRHAMACDSRRNRVSTFGGWDQNYLDTNDLHFLQLPAVQSQVADWSLY